LPRKGTKARALLDRRREAAARARAAYQAQRAAAPKKTPEQIKKAADNKRYRDNLRARAKRGDPDALRTLSNSHRRAEPAVQSFPLDLIPDKMPASLRERGHRAPPEASIGGVNARLWFAMELLRFVRGE
jgi:hypothetical protein